MSHTLLGSEQRVVVLSTLGVIAKGGFGAFLGSM